MKSSVMLHHPHEPTPLLLLSSLIKPINSLRNHQFLSLEREAKSMEGTEKRDEKDEEMMKGARGDENDNVHEQNEDSTTPPLMALNHVSRLCRSVEKSVDFYVNVLGFVQTKRPPTLNFDGAWLFNYGIGIHLVQSNENDHRLPERDDDLDPMDNHISFQCEDTRVMEKNLKKRDIKYKKRIVKGENGEAIEQLFFKDPDGFMIEICNCENLKLVPAESRNRIKLPSHRHNPPVELNHHY